MEGTGIDMAKQDSSGDVPGNAMASAAAFQKAMIRKGALTQEVDMILEKLWDDGIEITGIRFKPPDGTGKGWLAVVTGVQEGTKIVAFHDAPDFGDCLEGLLNRMKNRSIKFREDTYGR